MTTCVYYVKFSVCLCERYCKAVCMCVCVCVWWEAVRLCGGGGGGRGRL